MTECGFHLLSTHLGLHKHWFFSCWRDLRANRSCSHRHSCWEWRQNGGTCSRTISLDGNSFEALSKGWVTLEYPIIFRDAIDRKCFLLLWQPFASLRQLVSFSVVYAQSFAYYQNWASRLQWQGRRYRQSSALSFSCAMKLLADLMSRRFVQYHWLLARNFLDSFFSYYWACPVIFLMCGSLMLSLLPSLILLSLYLLKFWSWARWTHDSLQLASWPQSSRHFLETDIRSILLLYFTTFNLLLLCLFQIIPIRNETLILCSKICLIWVVWSGIKI